MKSIQHSCFHTFSNSISEIEIPKKFTFPFFYEAHPLAKIAAKEIQEYLKKQTDFEHNFGLDEHKKGAIGKMFGVLVVKDKKNKLGFLAAFSGKLANANHHPYFVPPVFDLLEDHGFFKAEEEVLNEINAEIEKLEKQEELLQLKQKRKKLTSEAEKDIQLQKNRIVEEKRKRDEIRKQNLPKLDVDAKEKLNVELSEASKKESILLKKMKKYWKLNVEKIDEAIQLKEKPIQLLKQKRKQKSAALQQKIFKHYAFLNAKQEHLSLGDIFNNNPPAGAGECAAPKLMQYAYLNHFKPICMAEFWWGDSPPSQVRKHQQFYPACRSKCEPILGHMLQGLSVEENPLLQNPAEGKQLAILFEDAYLVAIHKPAEFLSVPGKNLVDSVLTRAKKLFPNASGPLLVHRLDMSTSGILLIAKSEKIHKKLQALFIQRKVRKRYVALLNGVLKEKSGTINLPLRVDLDNRPHQLVCYDYGKPAITQWKRIEVKNKQTRVHFFPISGRTHQLRVHAAHQLGLNLPIVGDDLYGNKAERLYLHAEEIQFIHPISKKEVKIYSPAEF
ncbi:RluA family pseudouridine synthase [Psychroflexus salis]|uniref:RNA pseudouridine synthase n=1 Tax=Psychroflexus salis TaxID=1526574 RepID=A0A916ZPW9_9FLAO|nr:RluA family pseudouridine synthase [Psychroflexus salis]GGE08268.1 RNA pseudouridine synthase [Psychroflexus salis]